MSTLRVIPLILIAVLLPGCVSEWRGRAAPTTYALPEYRANRSVGNLRRLAVLPSRIVCKGAFALWTSSSRHETGAVCEACGHLMAKGYEVIRISGEDGWTADAVVDAEAQTLQDLQREWEVADGDRAEVVRSLGRLLWVDGVVTVWAENSQCGKEGGDNVGSLVAGAALGVANVFLMDLPLLYYLSHTSSEAVVYETASGSIVWRSKVSGPVTQQLRGNYHVLFSDMENAIPPQLAQ